MTAIHDLLNVNTIPDPIFTNSFDDGSLQFPSFGEDWSQDWSDDLNLHPQQSWNNLCDGLFLAGGQEPTEHVPDTFAESSIDTWAAENLAIDPSALTPPDSQAEDAINMQASQPAFGQVCYGMVYRAAARLTGEMSNLDSKLHAPDMQRNARSYVFSIDRTLTHTFMYFADRTEFAILNAQVSKALTDVLAVPGVAVEAFADTIEVSETIRRSKKVSEATVRVNMNVYGSAEVGQTIATLFSEHKIWLQHPEHRRPGSTYDNPHFVTFPEVSLPNAISDTGIASQDGLLEEKDRFDLAITQVYASLKRETRLRTVEGDFRLRTPLLLHQKTALDFMLQREIGPIEPEFSLWRADNGQGEDGGFSHIITKAKARVKPPETGGGILADEMGMGKSLSILALVTKTLEAAHAWQRGEDRSLADLISAEEPKLTPSRATLVLVPSALLLDVWQAEIKKHLREEITVVLYHGRHRRRELPLIPRSDIVLSTYQTVAIESSGALDRSDERQSPLHDFAWFRIVLDEAHIIRRRTTTFYETASRLQGKSRWCLSGTPIQNKLEDIGSLFAFIRAYPFDKVAEFRRFIALPFDHDQSRKLASRRLTQLIDSTCLRRSRGLLHLPSQNEIVRQLTFSESERTQYRKTKTQMSRRLHQEGTFDAKNNTFGQFHVQLQLRILCNHGTFQDPYSWMRHDMQSEREDIFYLRSGQGNREVKCSLCRQWMPYLSTNQVYRTFTGNCAHVLCDECLELQLENVQERSVRPLSTCPICQPPRAGFATPNSATPPSSQETDQYFTPNGRSIKMDALMSDLLNGLQETKSIVFSCWTKTLDLIAKHLKMHDIEYGRIDGDSAVARRQKTLEDFEKSTNVRVLIMTTGTGAFGLNLADANRIFIVEPQWNPSIENQAIARALRLGQSQHVQVIRYVIKDTVEMEMRSQQQKKIQMAALADMASNS